MSTKKILIICGGILLAAAAVTILVFMTEPTAQQEGASKQMAMLVQVTAIEKGDFTPVIQATGTVQPVEDVMLSPLVSGQVIKRSDRFVPGGFVEEGTLLLQIDPSDFRNQLDLRKSELLQAETDLEMEMGRQEVAQQDLQLVGGDSLSNRQRSLVLREPQLNAVKARIQAAKAAVEQAEINLSRTSIRAPFDAHILSQNVTLGSQVTPGDNLGRLVGTDYYWVNLAIPVNKLAWLDFPDSEEEKGSEVILNNNSAWPKGSSRTGFLDKQVGALDSQTRLAQVLIKVPDPLGREAEDDIPRLMIGTFVEANIQAKEIKDVIRLDRDLVRTNETVWVMQDGKLSIRQVEIALTDSEYAYIREGLDANDKVVLTNLSTVTEGIRLRTEAMDSLEGEKKGISKN
ncbi:efflux RND transporter periplasmic adaptor subunit [Gramella sp. GC03-9]|uniref:Efflux RND transporter periplasmic adaptor subunit n=1 Tax=Christiangramia oceanisediminis TaxID=2920386 RepID=A0A9X2KZS2_9FLAO|nr:efflux RND transporter periplasmic adaptor subunit [Gramella oceanisediminis]MCP9201365.1 efflux RND transporter periplasmic adaptor subunit [Gramella oceanisediminis]